jgi:hypothetical protein
MQSLILFALLSTAFFYLGSRATITSFLWSRYPKRFAKFMDCPACSGFWYGAALALAAIALDVPLPLELRASWWAPIVVGWMSIVWTPIGSAMLQNALETVGSVIPEE